jgi:serine/threonine protein kinase/tetratricopeptide (TPR) repeat protein
VCSRTRLQTDQRKRQIRIGQQLRTGKLLAHKNLAAFSQGNRVKGGLTQIDADGCGVHDDPPSETAELCYSAADHLVNPCLAILIAMLRQLWPISECSTIIPRNMALTSGSKLGPYEILSLLGAGGMGEVYRARDPALGRDVAIKVLPELAIHDPERLRRFEQEARAAAALNHPNILAVFQMGTYEGIPYIVSELLEGATLRSYLQGRALSVPTAVDYAQQIARGLTAAHEKGLIHRDLKPENLFVTNHELVKILDFGLAKLVRAAPEANTVTCATEPGRLMGSAGYMSPEQVRGQDSDHRSDIFAFGAILYEMLTGERAFNGATSAEVMSAILTQDPEELQRGKPRKVPFGLANLVRRCLEKNPERRFQSARDLVLDLESPAIRANLTSRFSSKRWGAVAAALILLTAIAVWRSSDLHDLITAERSSPARSIAVLPLLNLSSDASQDYFADGMTEALTTDLARMESLQVISRSSSMGYKGTTKPLPVIARELHADAVVEGSVQRVGGRVRITAQLIRAASDKHLWAETYERDTRDILALEDEVAGAIAQQVASRLGGPQPKEGRAQAKPISPDAYEAYLKANFYLDQFDLQKSIEYYDEAIKLDPDFAPAYAHLARSYFFLGFFSAIPPQQAWGRVKEAAVRAVEKDDRLPAAHGALALAKLHYDWDFRGAENEFKRALELNPNDADIRHDYAHYLMAMNRMDESDAESKRAVELDPVDEGLTDCLCWHSYAARKYDNSMQMALDLLRRQPNDSFELAILAWDYEQKGWTDRAIAEFKKALQQEGKDSPLHTFLFAALGHAYALAGMKAEATQVLQTLRDQSKQSYVSPFDVGLIYTALGDKDSAFAWMNKAVAERSTSLVYSQWEPRLDPLRSDPRFSQMLKRIGFAI